MPSYSRLDNWWSGKSVIRLHVYRTCVVCKKIFRVMRSKLSSRPAMFCTQKCHRLSRRLFRLMLADGRLETLLKEFIAEEQKRAA
jgi:hypothetical protein